MGPTFKQNSKSVVLLSLLSLWFVFVTGLIHKQDNSPSFLFMDAYNA